MSDSIRFIRLENDSEYQALVDDGAINESYFYYIKDTGATYRGSVHLTDSVIKIDDVTVIPESPIAGRFYIDDKGGLAILLENRWVVVNDPDVKAVNFVKDASEQPSGAEEGVLYFDGKNLATLVGADWVMLNDLSVSGLTLVNDVTTVPSELTENHLYADLQGGLAFAAHKDDDTVVYTLLIDPTFKSLQQVSTVAVAPDDVRFGTLYCDANGNLGYQSREIGADGKYAWIQVKAKEAEYSYKTFQIANLLTVERGKKYDYGNVRLAEEIPSGMFLTCVGSGVSATTTPDGLNKKVKAGDVVEDGTVKWKICKFASTEDVNNLQKVPEADHAVSADKATDADSLGGIEAKLYATKDDFANYADNYQRIDDKVVALTEKVDNFDKTYVTSDKIDEINSSVESLKETDNQFKTEFENFSGSVTQQFTDINTKHDDLANKVADNWSGNQESINEINSRLDTTVSRVDTLESGYTSVVENGTQLANSFTQQIKDINTKHDDLANKVADNWSGNQEAINGLTTRVGNLETQGTAAITQVNSTLEELKNADQELTKSIEDKINSLTWKPAVDDQAAMVAMVAPQEGWTVSLKDTNKIYRFDADYSGEMDAQHIASGDGTPGAWVELGHSVYALATQNSDGLMSAADKKILDEIPATYVTIENANAAKSELDQKISAVETTATQEINTLKGYFTDGKANTAVSSEDAQKLGGLAPEDYAKVEVTSGLDARITAAEGSINSHYTEFTDFKSAAEEKLIKVESDNEAQSTSITNLESYFDAGKAKNSINSDTLGGNAPDYYATAQTVTDISGKVSANETAITGLQENVSRIDTAEANITTLQGYFEGDAAKKANELVGFTPADYYTKADVDGAFVKQEDGKGLSSNDFTADYKQKLDAIDSSIETAKSEAMSYTDTKAEELSEQVSTISGYFEGEKAKEAVKADDSALLEGHSASYFATTEQLNQAINGLEWKSSIGDISALKEVATPQEGWTISVDSNNAIYRFDSECVEDADNDKYVKADDGTAGAWVKLSTLFYNTATASAEGLMSAADKEKLDGLTNYELKAATAEVLGGVKIGSGVSVTADGTISVAPTDLSGYYTKEEVDSEFVKQEEGKVLSTNDFTTEEKEKLASLGAADTYYSKSEIDEKDAAINKSLSDFMTVVQGEDGTSGELKELRDGIADNSTNLDNFIKVIQGEDGQGGELKEIRDSITASNENLNSFINTIQGSDGATGELGEIRNSINDTNSNLTAFMNAIQGEGGDGGELKEIRDSVEATNTNLTNFMNTIQGADGISGELKELRDGIAGNSTNLDNFIKVIQGEDGQSGELKELRDGITATQSNLDSYISSNNEEVAGVQSTLKETNSAADQTSGVILALQDQIAILKKQLQDLKTPDAEEVVIADADITEDTKDIKLVEQTVTDAVRSVTAKSVQVEDMKSANSRVVLKATDGDVSIDGFESSGDLPKSTANAAMSIYSGGDVTITNATINQSGYNSIEIGLNTDSVPKNVVIDGIDFASKMSNNAILIFAHQKNATITISNCHFADVSNCVRISNRENVPATIKFINCTCDAWESRPGYESYRGFLILEDYTSTNEEDFKAKNRFANLDIQFTNCYGPDGKIVGDASNLAVAGEKQVVYICVDNWNSTVLDYEGNEQYFPKISAI